MSQFINIKKALFRLWLALSIPWFVWFGWQTYDSYRDKIDYQNLSRETYEMIIETSKDLREGKEYQRAMHEWATKRIDELVNARDDASWRFNLNIALLLIPFIFVLFYPLIIWVMYGFKKS